jgi:hypothetical protein
MNDVTAAETGKEKKLLERAGNQIKTPRQMLRDYSVWEEQIITVHYSTYPNENGCKMKFDMVF